MAQLYVYILCFICFFKHKTAYEMRISDWSSDVCSSDLDEDMDAGPRPPDFRDALALMLDRVTTLSVKRPGVDPERLPVERPDIVAEADAIRELILGFPDLALSPIDDVRDRIEAEGQRL